MEFELLEIKIDNTIFIIENTYMENHRIYRKNWKKCYFFFEEIRNKKYSDVTNEIEGLLREEWKTYSDLYIKAVEKFDRLMLLT